eukprot:TRINITY_DN28994_c0_g1_i1.p1 TRINITY_DN28994_c0_g1~~TRINITY_DN28994_c0_g1_i1.p1  ORF type:complete len:255 (+),score=32.74 TRINITY_DN28994_c0_g1_i1:112-765(+)
MCIRDRFISKVKRISKKESKKERKIKVKVQMISRFKNTSPQPKGINYQPQGTGRDTYILTNNGGLVKTPKFFLGGSSNHLKINLTPQITPRNQQIPIKTVRYQLNGTGRDIYIYNYDNGNQQEQPRRLNYFIKNLRQYPQEPLSQSQLQKLSNSTQIVFNHSSNNPVNQSNNLNLPPLKDQYWLKNLQFQTYKKSTSPIRYHQPCLLYTSPSPRDQA